MVIKTSLPVVTQERVKVSVKEITPYTETLSNALSDVKNVLKSKGYVDDSTPITKLDDVINDAFANVQKTWADVSNLVDQTTEVLYTYTTNNHKYLYVSSKATNYGIYCFDCETGEKTKILSSGKNWDRFFETSNGVVLVSSSNSASKGVYKLNGKNIEKLNFGDITETYNYDSFFEMSNKKVYFTSVASNVYSLYELNGSQIKLVYSGTELAVIYEANGYLLFNCNVSPYEMYIFDGENTTLIANGDISDRNNKYHNVFISDDGSVYAYPDNTGGIIRYGYMLLDGKNTKFIRNLDTGTNIRIGEIFGDKNGNVYAKIVGSPKFLALINGETITKLTDTEGYYNSIITDNEGNLYVIGDSSSTKLIKVDGANTTILQSNASGGEFFKSENKIYVFGFYGVSYLENDQLVSISTVSCGSNRALEGKNGNVYLIPSSGSVISNYWDIKTIKDNDVTVLKVNSCYHYYGQDKKGYYYFSTTEKPTIGALIIKETEDGLVHKIYLGD